MNDENEYVIILDSERNDECIDFNMMCVFIIFVFIFIFISTYVHVEIMLRFSTSESRLMEK